jgi:hypothetical protein
VGVDQVAVVTSSGAVLVYTATLQLLYTSAQQHFGSSSTRRSRRAAAASKAPSSSEARTLLSAFASVQTPTRVFVLTQQQRGARASTPLLTVFRVPTTPPSSGAPAATGSAAAEPRSGTGAASDLSTSAASSAVEPTRVSVLRAESETPLCAAAEETARGENANAATAAGSPPLLGAVMQASGARRLVLSSLDARGRLSFYAVVGGAAGCEQLRPYCVRTLRSVANCGLYAAERAPEEQQPARRRRRRGSKERIDHTDDEAEAEQQKQRSATALVAIGGGLVGVVSPSSPPKHQQSKSTPAQPELTLDVWETSYGTLHCSVGGFRQNATTAVRCVATPTFAVLSSGARLSVALLQPGTAPLPSGRVSLLECVGKLPQSAAQLTDGTAVLLPPASHATSLYEAIRGGENRPHGWTEREQELRNAVLKLKSAALTPSAAAFLEVLQPLLQANEADADPGQQQQQQQQKAGGTEDAKEASKQDAANEATKEKSTRRKKGRGGIKAKMAMEKQSRERRIQDQLRRHTVPFAVLSAACARCAAELQTGQANGAQELDDWTAVLVHLLATNQASSAHLQGVVHALIAQKRLVGAGGRTVCVCAKRTMLCYAVLALVHLEHRRCSARSCVCGWMRVCVHVLLVECVCSRYQECFAECGWWLVFFRFLCLRSAFISASYLRALFLLLCYLLHAWVLLLSCNNQQPLLRRYLKHVQDIDEADLVCVLAFVLDQEVGEFHLIPTQRTRRRHLYVFSTRLVLFPRWLSSRSPVPVSRAHVRTPSLCRNSILSRPFNGVFLTHALRGLATSSAILLLDHISLCLQYYGHCVNSRVVASLSKEKLPSQAQLLEWAQVVVDAHISQLVLWSGDLPERVLGTLRDVVRFQLKSCEALRGLKGQCTQLKQRKALPVAQIPLYGVELLNV